MNLAFTLRSEIEIDKNERIAERLFDVSNTSTRGWAVSAIAAALAQSRIEGAESHQALLRAIWDQFASYTDSHGTTRFTAGGLTVLEEVAEVLDIDPYPDRKKKI